MTLKQAVKDGFKHYAGFDGRSTRASFWYWQLFQFLAVVVWVVVRAILAAIGGPLGLLALVFSLIFMVFWLGLIVPSLALVFRRLHDTGHSAWWILLSLTGIGGILLLVWYCTPSQPGSNKYGPNPLEPDVQTVF